MALPLGRAIGNAIEVREAIDVLRGGGDPELTEVSLAVAREMCALAGSGADPARAIADGGAEAKLWELLEAQGGSRERPPEVHPVRLTLTASEDGWVSAIDALRCGLAVIDLGGGRLRKDDAIDHGAGLVVAARVGERVRAGDALVRVHAASDEIARRALPRLEGAWRLSPGPPPARPHVLYRIDRDGARLAPTG